VLDRRRRTKRNGDVPKRVVMHAKRLFAGIAIVARALPADHQMRPPAHSRNAAHDVYNVATDDAAISAALGPAAVPGPFFGSTRAAGILPSRPPMPRPPRAGPVKAGRLFGGHPEGLALTGPSTAACLIGSGPLKR
jgi:hypothetical protein